MKPVYWLRLEGAVVLAGSVMLYATHGAGLMFFVLLLFVPDLFMLGYLKDTRLGALVYNVGHSYLLPASSLVVALALGNELGLAVALIWIAHIGLDRLLGYGLKYEDSFKATHLSAHG